LTKTHKVNIILVHKVLGKKCKTWTRREWMDPSATSYIIIMPAAAFFSSPKKEIRGVKNNTLFTKHFSNPSFSFVLSPAGC
jgi:hypothetical protein